MSNEPIVCPSCRVEVDPISIERCTGCGLHFSAEMIFQLRSTYQDAAMDVRFSDLVKRKRTKVESSVEDQIPVAAVDRLVITGESIQPTISVRQRWGRSLPARICLRSGVALSIWSLLVCVLGPLALIPAFAGFALSMISLTGFEKLWAMIGVSVSLLAIFVVFMTIQMQSNY